MRTNRILILLVIILTSALVVTTCRHKPHHQHSLVDIPSTSQLRDTIVKYRIDNNLESGTRIFLTLSVNTAVNQNNTIPSKIFQIFCNWGKADIVSIVVLFQNKHLTLKYP